MCFAAPCPFVAKQLSAKIQHKTRNLFRAKRLKKVPGFCFCAICFFSASFSGSTQCRQRVCAEKAAYHPCIRICCSRLPSISGRANSKMLLVMGPFVRLRCIVPDSPFYNAVSAGALALPPSRLERDCSLPANFWRYSLGVQCLISRKVFVK